MIGLSAAFLQFGSPVTTHLVLCAPRRAIGAASEPLPGAGLALEPIRKLVVGSLVFSSKPGRAQKFSDRILM